MADIIRMAIIGAGKIAGDSHVPTIKRHPRFECLCTVSPQGAIKGVPNFATLAEALAAVSFEAVAICTPPQVRRDIALECIAHGRHVLLEKPPAQTPEDAASIGEAAVARGVTAFASWHSRYSEKIQDAKRWLAGRSLVGGSITWREDVCKWHPGQDWLWAEGGLGVFDAGINPLSILIELVGDGFSVDGAEFEVPKNAATPVEARFTLHHGDVAIRADLSFLEQSGDIWRICLEDIHGERLVIDYGDSDGDILDEEYFGLYNRFASLVDAGISEVDVRPLELVVDVFRSATRKRVAAVAD